VHFGLLLVGLAVVGCTTAARAENVHQRRVAAELVVMGGDLRRLIHEPVGSRERQGLEQRLAGALSSLPLALRRAGTDAARVGDLRKAQARRDWPALAAGVDKLKRRHPFDTRRLLDAKPTPEVLALGASIHQTTCASCHDAPWGDVLLPARNLATQLKSMPAEEFAARLLLGVRGDRAMALANPFSDSELAALITWYAQAP
jgi:mono/diheme cytochrome c family protein